jgi:formylglycine-generating enzyme required for sulfatase activity
VPCAAPPKAGEVCIPGGAFMLGDPAFRGRSSADIFEERLAWVSPFYIDQSEVTVGAYRAARPAGSAAPMAYDGTRSAKESYFCTWTEQAHAPVLGATDNDKLPLNCVSWATAHAFCLARGADLPTEAQLEYASSGLGEEWAYAWGNDEPDCNGAVWGRAGAQNTTYVAGSGTCRTTNASGVAFPGSGTNDRVNVALNAADPEVLDLGGNVSEWARDAWSRQDEPFWGTTLPMIDPVASFASSDPGHTVRGGNWARTVLDTRAAYRAPVRGANELAATLGFRCARPAGPGRGQASPQ